MKDWLLIISIKKKPKKKFKILERKVVLNVGINYQANWLALINIIRNH